MKIKLLFALVILFLEPIFCEIQAQERQSFTINSNWKFFKGDIDKLANSNIIWDHVTIPHSWNKQDVMDDEPSYYRGLGVYKKDLFVPAAWKEKDVYLHFEGSAQVTEVFINGVFVGKHIGSYNAFNFSISKFLKFSDAANSKNEIVVKVDNSFNKDIPPLTADFTFYGGIYRDVYLQAVDKIHFDMDNYASNGIFLTTPAVSEDKAELNIKGNFVNRTSQNRNLIITHQIIDADGKLIKQIEQKYLSKAASNTDFNEAIKEIFKPQLWSIEKPYLYRLISTITDFKTKEKIDQVSNPLGFRWYSFDAEKGFYLNGKSVKLIGASRHQDFKDMANALTDDMHVRDVELLKQMGGNFLRIAHYPQDLAILQACDRLGILTSVETPIVNQITESVGFANNAKTMHLEMIRQHYNHPSLIIWAYMNEVLLRPLYEKESQEQEEYFNKITKLAQEIEDITRKEDPYRYTLIPNHGNFDLYRRVKLTAIPKLVGWNLYQGWYSGKLDGFADFLDKHHKELPDKPLLITEYGSDADSRLHSFSPIRFDKTVEYTNQYHQVYFKAMMERPFVAAGMIWNLAEFNTETRTETMPHINNKGIMTWDRKPKDAYRFYQANLLKSPYLQIGSKEWSLRSGFAQSETDATCIQPVLVFSNQEKVSLKLNGKLIGNENTIDGMASFNVPFINGINRVTVSTEGSLNTITDQIEINFKMLSQNLKSKIMPFTELNISLGDPRFFYDENANQVWLPEQAYKPGSWGYIGGKIFAMEKSVRQSFGSDKNIFETDLDPIFETQRVGIEQFKFDVPSGDYELILHFAELLSEDKKEELIYNLSNGKSKDEFLNREFSVSINGNESFLRLNNQQNLIPERAFSTKLNISLIDEKGISVDFKAFQSLPILNGIQLKKIR